VTDYLAKTVEGQTRDNFGNQDESIDKNQPANDRNLDHSNALSDNTKASPIEDTTSIEDVGRKSASFEVTNNGVNVGWDQTGTEESFQFQQRKYK
jgi:hypothetical protein